MYCSSRANLLVQGHPQRGIRSTRLILFGAVGLPVIFLMGCDWFEERPEILQCERWVQLGLAAPSTYKRIGVEIADSPPLSREEFQIRAGLDRAPQETGLRIRTVYLSYDAANGFGVPIRNTKACLFQVSEADRTRDLYRAVEMDRPGPPWRGLNEGSPELEAELKERWRADACCILEEGASNTVGP